VHWVTLNIAFAILSYLFWEKTSKHSMKESAAQFVMVVYSSQKLRKRCTWELFCVDSLYCSVHLKCTALRQVGDLCVAHILHISTLKMAFERNHPLPKGSFASLARALCKRKSMKLSPWTLLRLVILHKGAWVDSAKDCYHTQIAVIVISKIFSSGK